MDEPNSPVDWSGVNRDVAERIFLQGDTFLQQQLQVGLAADSRAITAASIFATLSTTLVAGSLALGTDARSIPLLVAGLSAGTMAGFGAAFGFWAARPITFFYAGNHPAQWWACRKQSIEELLGAESENYQERIVFNDNMLAKNAKALQWGVRFAASAPLCAVFAWTVATYFFP